ncbi:MAG: PKD domain-containing protein [Flavisolibacter sp.]
MKTSLLFLCVAAFSIISCKKDHTTILAPEASFTIDGNTSSPLIMGPYDQFSVANTSTNADSYFWDFGDGRTSTQKEVGLQYKSSGTYTVTLTASKNGKTSVTSRKVKVVDPVLKKVVISRLSWNSGWGRPASWPTFTRANVWVEIVKGAPNQTYPVLSGGTFAAPVIYKSSVVNNVDSTAIPITFAVLQKTVIDIPTLMLEFGYSGIGYGINLYAQDATGIYLLASNFWSGVSTTYQGSYVDNRFTITTGVFGSSVQLVGDYE